MTTRTIIPETNVMAAEPIKHRYGVINAAAAAHNTTLSSSDVVDIREWEAIAVKPATATTLTFHGSETENGTYVLIDNIGTNGVVTLAAAKWTALDVTKIKPFGYIKMLASAADTVSIIGKT